MEALKPPGILEASRERLVFEANQRVKQKEIATTFSWLDTFQESYREISNRPRSVYKGLLLAEQGREFVINMWAARQNITSRYEEALLFGRTLYVLNDKSLVRCHPLVLQQLIGSYTTLTFLDLINRTNPALLKDKEVGQLIDYNTDFYAKVDLEFVLGERVMNIDGRPEPRQVIGLFQLKAGHDNDENPIEIWPWKKSGDEDQFKGLVKKKELEKILKYIAEEKERDSKDKQVFEGKKLARSFQVFVVKLPAVNGKIINDDPFARIINRYELVQKFARRATEVGIYK